MIRYASAGGGADVSNMDFPSDGYILKSLFHLPMIKISAKNDKFSPQPIAKLAD